MEWEGASVAHRIHPKALTPKMRGCKLIIIIIFIYCNWVVTRWQWLFYMYTKYEIGY